MLTDQRLEIAVVVATHNRPARLEKLLRALEEQTLDASRYEVVIVDDSSTDLTPDVLRAAVGRGDLPLRVLRQGSNTGPAGARQAGWRATAAPLVAFTDDDCVPLQDWLERGLEAARRGEDAIVQGRTEPDPRELSDRTPYSRLVRIDDLDPSFQTCNIFYPRAILERVGGFDTMAFGRAPGGEDSDLAWRAIKAGATVIFEPKACVYHAVERSSPMGRLRYAARWTTPMLAYARHPELRRAHFVKGVFWKGSHYLLARALVALVLPRRLRRLRPWLAGPYFLTLRPRLRREGAGALLAPYLVVRDLIEMWSVLRAAARYRRLMI